ncbi:MAG: Sec-independent protein translocase protein TatB [Methylotenera sp.]
MFDISFSKLIVIALVALIVIGPEKLPKVARMLGMLAGRMQKYVAQIKEEVNREARFEELQQLQQEIKEAANKTQASIQSNLQSVAETFKHEVEDFQLTAVDQQSPTQTSLELAPLENQLVTKTMPVKKPRAKKVTPSK